MNKRSNSFISLLFKKFFYHTKIVKHIKKRCLNSFLSQYFLISNLSKYLNISHFLSFLFHLNITSLFFFTTQEMTKMNRSIINRLNMINDFLIEIENHDIITLSKFNLDDEFIKINTLWNVINYTQFLLFIKKNFKKFW